MIRHQNDRNASLITVNLVDDAGGRYERSGTIRPKFNKVMFVGC